MNRLPFFSLKLVLLFGAVTNAFQLSQAVNRAELFGIPGVTYSLTQVFCEAKVYDLYLLDLCIATSGVLYDSRGK